MRIKRLNLERWMKSERSRSTCGGFVEAPPVLFKDGYYKCGNTVWFETEGKAFIFYKDDGMFNYTLCCLNAWQRINPRQAQALKFIIDEGLEVRSQRVTYNYYKDYADRRRMLRDFWKRHNQATK